jgi:sugar-phosphatase
MRTFECAAILFDLDGVLVDSTASVGRVWKNWAEQHGLDPEQVIRTAHGRRSIETIRACAPHIDAQSALRIVEQLEIDDTLDLAVIAGARELLSSLPHDKWAVVTSGTRALATSRLKAAGLPIPSILVSADEVNHGKPHPEPYLRGAQLMGLAPEQCVVFEDTPPGIQAGHAAGIPVLALTTTYPAEMLQTADAIIRSLADIQVNTANGALMIEAHIIGPASARQ